MENNSEPICLGGFGEPTFGKQYKPGRRVYNSAAIAMCHMGQPIGQVAGYTYLYLVVEKVDNGK